MSFPLTTRQGLIVVSAEVIGPTGGTIVELALDTGANQTVIAWTWLLGIGFDPSQAMGTTQIVSGTGQAIAPVLFTYRVTALGVDRVSFPVVAHNLPPGAGFDGLLGLDFFQGRTLTLDFRNVQITLT
jgi:hypothetical protein